MRNPRRADGGLTAREALYGKGSMQTLFLYWYQMGQRITTNEYALKLFMIERAIRYHRTDATFVRLSIGIGDGGVDAAEAVLFQFAALCVPELDNFQPR